MRRSFLVPIGLMWALSACAPVFSRHSLDQVEPDISFQALLQDPAPYKGKIVMYGGEILQARVETNETWVEILQKPLDREQRPQDTDVSYGRFLVYFKEPQDPAIYAPGRKITVIGEVQEKRLGKIQDRDYVYPVLTPRESHLWRPGNGGMGPFFHFGIGIGGVIR